jgi:hypothetical protein
VTVAKRIGATLLLIGIALLVVWGVRVARIATSLQSDLAQAQAIADAKDISPQSACDLAKNLRSDVVELNQQAGILVSLTPVLGGLPSVGGDLRAAPDLFATADGLTESGAIVCASLAPMLDTMGKSGGFSLEQMTALLAANRANLERAALAADRAQSAWTRLDSQQLSPSIARRIQLLDRGLPLVRAAVTALAVAPDLLGVSGTQTFLILALNEDELRPGGGFISGAGRVKLDQGKIVELSFLDGNVVDDLAHVYYPDPPAPLFNYMASEMWLFRDANWSPDFPTSAHQAAYLYELGQGTQVDGVIAIDQRAIELIMSGLGDIQVSGFKEPVTATNIRQLMHEAWNPSEAGITHEWVFSRKEFIGRLASAIRNQLETQTGQINLPQTALGIYRALAERHLQIFFNNPKSAAALSQMGWDGAVRSSDGDYVMVVDANLGFGKVNSLIKQSIDYRVALRPDGTAEANLSISYTQLDDPTNVRCQQGFPYVGNLTYDAMMHRCYYDYLRVLVPTGSALRSATAYPTPAEYFLRNKPDDGKAMVSSEAGKTVLAQFFVVEYGKTLTTRFDYDLPIVAPLKQNQRTYSVLFQKQPGTNGTGLSLTVTLPPGAKLVSAMPAPSANDNGKLVFTLQFDTDVVVRVVYE